MKPFQLFRRGKENIGDNAIRQNSSLLHVTHTVICTGGLNWEGHKDQLGLKNVVLVLNMEVVL